jgi:hypothetical protein
MEGYKFIKPKNQKIIIRDPISKIPLNENGELKPWIGREGIYWRRRVKDGSCIITEQPETPESNNNESNNRNRRGGR